MPAANQAVEDEVENGVEVLLQAAGLHLEYKRHLEVLQIDPQCMGDLGAVQLAKDAARLAAAQGPAEQLLLELVESSPVLLIQADELAPYCGRDAEQAAQPAHVLHLGQDQGAECQAGVFLRLGRRAHGGEDHLLLVPQALVDDLVLAARKVMVERGLGHAETTPDVGQRRLAEPMPSEGPARLVEDDVAVEIVGHADLLECSTKTFSYNVSLVPHLVKGRFILLLWRSLPVAFANWSFSTPRGWMSRGQGVALSCSVEPSSARHIDEQW